jgi:hypothetical protein
VWASAVAKRRLRNPEDTEPEERTPEERREARKKERAEGSATKRKARGPASPWRRAGIAGGVSAVIVAVVVLLLLNPFHTQPPCLSFQTSPSGYPAFPPAGTTDFTSSWCPQNVPIVVQAYPLLHISIQSTVVTLPSAIGRNLNFSNYACNLPLLTQPATSSIPSNIVQIQSPWPYIYNLSAFFTVWSQSYASVHVNTSYPAQPIAYSNSSLLGFTADATHEIVLYVDNQPSSAGPSLELNTLSNLPNPYPSCLATIYGTGHTIVLAYRAKTATALEPGLRGPVGGTEAAIVPPPLLSTLPPVHGATSGLDVAAMRLVTLNWLVLKPA